MRLHEKKNDSVEVVGLMLSGPAKTIPKKIAKSARAVSDWLATLSEIYCAFPQKKENARV